MLGPDEAFNIVTEQEATRLLMIDLGIAESAVTRLAPLGLNENQFSAFVSFVFNLGAGAFPGSRLLARLKKSDTLGAAAEFPKWCMATVDGHKVKLDGLERRRLAERSLFLKPVLVASN